MKLSLSLLLISCHAATANTEIITFSPSRLPAHLVHLPGFTTTNPTTPAHLPRPTLRPSDNEQHWTLGAEPLWVLLDLDDDEYWPLTLRVSWPASVPADVSLALYGLSAHGRTRAARVVAVPRAPVVVPVVLVLERVYFGVPASLVPTLAFLVLVLLAAAWLVPRVTAFLEPYARQARADSETGITHKHT